MNAGSTPPAATFRARIVRPTAGARAYLGSAAAPRSLAKTPRGPSRRSPELADFLPIPRRLSAPVVSFPEKRVFLSRRRASPKRLKSAASGSVVLLRLRGLRVNVLTRLLLILMCVMI